MTSFFEGLTLGAGVAISRYFGAGDDARVERAIHANIFVNLLSGIFLTIFGVLLTPTILRWMGTDPEVLPDAISYFRYYFTGVLAVMLYNACKSVMNALGDSKRPLYYLLLSSAVNIALDILFIGGFGWGVAGASAATAISKVVSWCILMTPYFRKKTLLTIRFRQFRPRWSDAKEVCAMGSASFFRNGLGTLAGILLNRIAVGYGTSALAAINVANRITMFMTSACLGFGQGFQPVAGFSWGAKRFDRVRESFRFSMIACVAGISAVALIVGIFARPILLLFTEDDAELVRIGVFSLRIQCLAMPFHGFGIIVNMLCSGIGRALPSLLLGLARQGICFFPILPLMVRLWGVWGIASVQGAADMLVMLLAVPIAVRVSRDIRRREAEQGGEISPV